MDIWDKEINEKRKKNSKSKKRGVILSLGWPSSKADLSPFLTLTRSPAYTLSSPPCQPNRPIAEQF